MLSDQSSADHGRSERRSVLAGCKLRAEDWVPVLIARPMLARLTEETLLPSYAMVKVEHRPLSIKVVESSLNRVERQSSVNAVGLS